MRGQSAVRRPVPSPIRRGSSGGGLVVGDRYRADEADVAAVGDQVAEPPDAVRARASRNRVRSAPTNCAIIGDDGRLTEWLREHGTAVVRPDRHVYVVARGEDDLLRLARTLREQLGTLAGNTEVSTLVAFAGKH
jgi:hypothetical protein